MAKAQKPPYWGRKASGPALNVSAEIEEAK